MSRKRTQDWDGLLAEALALKALEPNMTCEDFYRRKGLNVDRARKMLGPKINQEWAKIRKAALAQVEKKAVLDLAKEMQDVLRVARSVMGRSSRAIFGEKLDGKNAEVQPKSFGEAVSAFRSASLVMQRAALLLNGREPLQKPEPTPPGPGEPPAPTEAGVEYDEAEKAKIRQILDDAKKARPAESK